MASPRRLEPLAVGAAVLLLTGAFLAVLLAWQAMWVTAAVFVLIPALAAVCEWARVRRGVAWLLVHGAWLLLIPLLIIVLVFCCAMALLAEGPEILLVIDWTGFWRRVRRTGHVMWAGWS